MPSSWSRFMLGTILLLPLLGVVLSPGLSQAKPRLPPGVKPLPDGQLRSPYSYGATLKWLRKHNRRGKRKLRFVQLIDLPDVIASHAQAPAGAAGWSGINVSEYQGKTRIFVLGAQTPKP